MTTSTRAPAPGAASQDAPEVTAPPAEQRVRLRRVTKDGALTLFGAAFGSLGLTWVLYERVLAFSGVLGFWLSWYVIFLLMYCAMAAVQWDRRAVSDRVASVAFGTGGILTCAIVLDQVLYVVLRGGHVASHLSFSTHTLARTGSLSTLFSGGDLEGIVGTLEMLGLATLFSVPLGITAAVFLSEVGGAWARPVRTLVEAMTALPDIIAGLFILAFAILTLGMQESGVAAALALAVTMMPIVTRGAEVVIRIVPGMLREASYALGASQWRTVLNVVLPTARSGLATAVVLAMARGIGETAPVLLTAGYAKGMNANPLHGWQPSLVTYIFNEHQLPDANDQARCFGAALTLMVLVLVLFAVARWLGGSKPGELSRRDRRRIARKAVR
ncbi:MAG TPA: ABC transporter permease subunit [Streptosporangiaceae bacterium]|jgi:phosphate transport system permease protein|nr:ABC transporter permease subunit [Streptosporangiaceae bacterium]